MWGHAHDEYASRPTNTSNVTSPKQKATSKKKRPTRPKRKTEEAPQELSPPPHAASGGNFKYRGKGGTSAEQKKHNPWSHAHDEYAQKKQSKKNRANMRIRFENTEDDHDNHPEEKSNRPLKKKRPKRPKKAPSYVSANNIHEQQFRTAYRPKPLPPLRNNQQRMAYGKANFETMIVHAAAREGLDQSDVRVQRMIQRVGDQMSEIQGFNRFLRDKDEDLAKLVLKQNKRRKTVDKMQKNMQNDDDDDRASRGKKFRKGSVKDLTQRFEQASVKSTRQQRRHGNRRQAGQAHRNALKLPNTKAHRRRVSSQFSVAAISAVLSANSSQAQNSAPYLDPDHIGLHLSDNLSNLSTAASPGHQQNNTLIVGDRRMSRDSRGSFSRGSRISVNQPSIMIDGDNQLIITTPAPDDDDGISSVGDRTLGAGDPLIMLKQILEREPKDRTPDEIDILVQFFENYQIMTEDVDTWSGKATFREFIGQTRYKHTPANECVFREGDDGDEFYFVLRGNVGVLVDDATTVHMHTGSKRDITAKQEIKVLEENTVFGEIAMFNQGKRSATCIAKTDTYLAYWDRTTYDEYIRPMKELKKKAQKILKDKQGNLLSEDQLIEKAAMFLDDAMHGRELKMHRNGPWPRRIHKLINHKYFNYCLVMVSMLYLALVFIEAPSYKDSINREDTLYSDRIMPLIAFEWFVFVIFASECALRFYSFGRSWFFTIDLHVTRVILLIIFGCDLCIACIYNGYAFRFSRFLRPIFAVLFIRDLRRQYYIVLACIPYIIELIFLWMIIAAIFARIAYHIFYHSEGDLEDGFTRKSVFMKDAFALGEYPYDVRLGDYCSAALEDDTLKNCGDFLDDFVWNSFGSFFKSGISLFTLLTTENFPEVWWPTWLSNEGHPYWTFFIAYALISIFFLLNLFSAAVYDAYQHIIITLDVIEEKRETQALKVAWICLDTGDTGAIGPQKFQNLMYRLKPEYTEFEVDVIFKLLDPDNNHLIDAEEFSCMMINVLYLRISRKTRSKDDELKLSQQRLATKCPFGYEILRAFTSQTWRYILLIVQFVDIIALLTYHQHYDAANIVDFLCILIILLALVLDVIFKHMSDLRTYFKSSRNRLYFGLTTIQTIGTFIGIFNDREWISALRFFGMLRILIVAVFALEKIRFLRTSLTRTLTQTVVFMIPVFFRIVVHVCVVLLYVYTVIGIELFVDPAPETHGFSRCDPPQQIQSNPYALFCDAQMTIITLIQILTTNNWHTIMYTAIQVTNNWYVAAYFITFFFLGPILVLSLVLAVFFNMFFGVTVQSEHELSAFFHETDMEAKQIQDHMELQQVKTQFDEELQYKSRDIPLPTECGISDLPNGHKILTIRQNIVKDPDNDDPDDPDNIETELVHIPLHQIAREIWEHIPGTEWLDDETNNTFKQTFNGRETTQFLLTKKFAPNEEEAVETLTVIMDEIGAFFRVDAGKKQEFENDINAHYQWIIIPDEEDENELNELNQMSDDEDNLFENDEVALDDIMIGFRHSYGGYQRLLKQYRKEGIDPVKQAAFAKAANVPATPVSPSNNTPAANDDDDNNENNDTENNNNPISHLRNKSQKFKDGIKQKLNKKTESNDANDVVIKLNNSSDDPNPPTVIALAKRSESSNLHALSSPSAATSTQNMSSSQIVSPKAINRIDSTSATKEKDSHDKKIDASDDTAKATVPLNSGRASAQPPTMLAKAKSAHGNKLIKTKSSRGLGRTASSKNILLGHLDKKKGGLI